MKQTLGEWLNEDRNLEADWPTKFEGLNELLRGGFRRQHLTILGGRPSMGKTTLATDQALDLSKLGAKVGFCSIERPGVELVEKISLSHTGGDPSPDEGILAELASLPMWIDDSGFGLTANEIHGLVENDPVDVLFIDYLQLMGHEQQWPNRNSEIDRILQELQGIHKDYGLQIVLLSQLSRAVESRRFQDDTARPELQDLRDSGAIEQTADEVILIHRDDYYREFKRNDGVTELIVAKNRLGPTGTVRVTFIPEEETFI